MEGSITWVGIDAHKKTLAVAVLSPGAKAPEEFTVDNNDVSIKKLARRLTKAAKGREVRACYEAGTCGFTLQRRLDGAGVMCDVIAPSLIPRKPGERFKTDRRDALKLAELSRSGLKMLVRRGLVFDPHQRLWSQAHRRWLDALAFDNPVDRTVVAEYKLAIEQTERRLRELDKELEKAAELPLYREHVAWLRCFRGIDTVIAMIFVAELHGIERFDSPRALAAYLGLVPSLHASGDNARHGKITKTGNGHIRRALVQACWQYRHRPNVGERLRTRRRGQPERVIGIAEKAERRLSGRYARLKARGKNSNKVVIAIARELVGFLWAALRDDREAGLQLRKVNTSKIAVGLRRKAQQEKRAI